MAHVQGILNFPRCYINQGFLFANNTKFQTKITDRIMVQQIYVRIPPPATNTVFVVIYSIVQQALLLTYLRLCHQSVLQCSNLQSQSLVQPLIPLAKKVKMREERRPQRFSSDLGSRSTQTEVPVEVERKSTAAARARLST